ncbi:MAG TPA: hypothetical protein EYG89_02725, partial [Bacteroidia bacterium]|nr:hypothetical protein [Bacteroidia bacterium]
MQRTLKRIYDYTYNYISRKLLNETHDTKLFISRLFSIIIDKMQQNQPITTILRNYLTFTNFIGSNETDLADLIKSVFKSDIEYLYELCSDTRHCRNSKFTFFSRFDDHNKEIRRAIIEFKKKLNNNVFGNILTSLENNVKKSENLIKDLKKIFDEVKNLTHIKINNSNTNINAWDSSYKKIIDSVEKYEEILEKAAENAKNDFLKLLHGVNNNTLLYRLKNFFNLRTD